MPEKNMKNNLTARSDALSQEKGPLPPTKNKWIRLSWCIAAGAACALIAVAAYAESRPTTAAENEVSNLYGRATTAPQPEVSVPSLGPMRDIPMTDPETGIPIVEDENFGSLLVEGEVSENTPAQGGSWQNTIEASYQAEEPDAEAVTPIWKTMTFDTDMRQGDTGDMVRVLQSRLMELGYIEPGDPSGTFDAATATGVSRFQRNHEITPTGVADVASLKIMMSNRATMYQMCFNQEGEDIRQLQERLNALLYPVSVTGYFDKETEEAVVAFQQKNGLTADGVVNLGTRAVLFSDAALFGSGTPSASAPPAATSNVGVEALIASAMQKLGTPYVLGGKGPETFDCSGLIYYCLNEIGYEIGYMTSHQWKDSAFPTVTGMNALVRGDIVCFDGHVGIYLGDGTMLDASSSEGKVRITGPLASSSYWTSNFICGKRVY